MLLFILFCLLNSYIYFPVFAGAKLHFYCILFKNVEIIAKECLFAINFLEQKINFILAENIIKTNHGIRKYFTKHQ